MKTDLERESPPSPKRRRRLRPGTLATALGVQAAILLVTIYVVVVRPAFRSEPEFKGKATVYLPQRELEHRVAVAEFEQAVAMPMPLERLSTSALLPPGLPALPSIQRSEFAALEQSDMLSRDAQALLAQSGFAGAANGFKGAASAAAFFGVEDRGERIVIVVNTSVSVRNKAQRRGVSWDRIQEEVNRVIDQLDGGTLFGIVQFSQGVRMFTDFPVPATSSNREAARQWVRDNLRGNPPVTAGQAWFGHEAAFESAFRLDPDVVFLVTDGVLDRREESGGRVSYPTIPFATLIGSVRGFARGAARETRVHVIGFEMRPADADSMRRLAGEFRGRVREF
jgi:hypothetical protein